MKENVQLIEYEEFCVDQSAEINKMASPKMLKEEFPAQEEHIEEFVSSQPEQVFQQSNLNRVKEASHQQEIAPTPKTTNKKVLFNFGTDAQPRGAHNSDSSTAYQQKSSVSSSVNKRKQDPFELPLQEAHSRPTSVPTSEIARGKAF